MIPNVYNIIKYQLTLKSGTIIKKKYKVNTLSEIRTQYKTKTSVIVFITHT